MDVGIQNWRKLLYGVLIFFLMLAFCGCGGQTDERTVRIVAINTNSDSIRISINGGDGVIELGSQRDIQLQVTLSFVNSVSVSITGPGRRPPRDAHERQEFTVTVFNYRSRVLSDVEDCDFEERFVTTIEYNSSGRLGCYINN